VEVVNAETGNEQAGAWGVEVYDKRELGKRKTRGWFGLWQVCELLMVGCLVLVRDLLMRVYTIEILDYALSIYIAASSQEMPSYSRGAAEH
jgi:hypothetical protein